MTRDEERRRAWGDAVYETWRRGGNPDAVSQERIDRNFYNGIAGDWDAAAEQEVQHVLGAAGRRQRERERAEHERYLECERYLESLQGEASDDGA